MDSDFHIEVSDLDLAYDDYVVQRDINFKVRRGEIFIIMGGSGCGKSTLLRHMIGLIRPVRGEILYNSVDFWASEPSKRDLLMRRFVVLYQNGALWSSMTVAENVGLPLSEFTNLSPDQIREIVSFKLSLVGLRGFENFYPPQLSGGMQKRAGLARAMALDPEILFFDEPTGGLDPINAQRLDKLILELRESLGTTVVVVTHELPTIFAVGDNSIFLDSETHTMIANGNPRALLAETKVPVVHNFLTRGSHE